ncbi:uncharacterized protein LOC114303363 [Camellia sinensis]|uniref:uncharacterized protein LOC114303363 n=1 Tax=Camellia sinensis TaxID=4442 RepID=UPI001036C211|nr:uncharacterized protein LOC114303363 [Camellia sinensis]
MTVAQYANRFKALSRCATAIVTNETDKVVDRALTLEREKMDTATTQGQQSRTNQPRSGGPSRNNRTHAASVPYARGHNNSKGTILNIVIGKGLEGVMNVAKKGILGTIALRGQATTSIKGRPLNETNAYQLRERELCKIPNPAQPPANRNVGQSRTQQPRNANAKKPWVPNQGATGRVFALQEGEDDGNPSVIRGILILMNSCVQVLFDSGASHSFISASCVATLGLEPEQLETPMSVASPLGGQTRVDLVFKSCELGVSSLRLTCDLRVMEMSDFDVILGMD